MLVRYFLIFLVIAYAAIPVGAQPAHPDFNGVWQGPYTPDLTRALAAGESIPFTAYGAERFQKVDPADNPDGLCLPVGPARGLQAPAPFQIVQNENVIAILFENQRIFRIVYLDDKKHPEDIADYPEWMGHSIGHWEGDKLVIDTVGINERTWLDTQGLSTATNSTLPKHSRRPHPITSTTPSRLKIRSSSQGPGRRYAISNVKIRASCRTPVKRMKRTKSTYNETQPQNSLRNVSSLMVKYAYV